MKQQETRRTVVTTIGTMIAKCGGWWGAAKVGGDWDCGDAIVVEPDVGDDDDGDEVAVAEDVVFSYETVNVR